MRILSAKLEDDNTDLSPAQVQADKPELERRHKDAMKNDPTWSMFGGVLTIENRVYQVSP